MTILMLALACGVPEVEEPGPEGGATAGGVDSGTGDGGGPSWEEDLELPELDPLALLSRVSLDLRGVRPSIAELERVEAGESVDDLAREFMEDPRFADRIVQIFSEIYLTRVDSFALGAGDFGLDDTPGFNRAVGEEPLRLLARVAAEDRPWTEIVTADWTVADDLLLEAFPLESTGEPGLGAWMPARYTDGRPAAGVLSTTGMWLRYMSTASNANRGRANQVSRILLCSNYLTREIVFDRDTDLLDEAAVADAIATNPACVNCHSSLDPLAAYLFGFWSYSDDSYMELSRYHPERERLYSDYLGVAPAYYGEPGNHLGDLGRQIAADPRFPACAVEQIYGALLDRDPVLGDMDALTGHREVFLDSGLHIKDLIASVIADPRYRADDRSGALIEDSGAATAKLMSPDQLDSAVADLTGYRWTYAGYEILGTDTVGVRTLAGGADGRTVTRNAELPNATALLVQQRLAEAGASYAVATERPLAPEQRHLFTEIDFTETSAPAEQIQRLHLLVFGRRVAPDGEEVAANQALWEELYAIDGDPAAAWAGLLSALLRDPDFISY